MSKKENVRLPAVEKLVRRLVENPEFTKVALKALKQAIKDTEKKES